jgi:hypothetical protein
MSKSTAQGVMRCLAFLSNNGLNAATLALAVFEYAGTAEAIKIEKQAIQNDAPALFRSLLSHSTCQQQALTFATETYRQEVDSLSKKESGLHFNATNTQFEQVEEFSVSGLTTRFESYAPKLFNLVSALLDSRGSARRVGVNWSEEELDDTDDELDEDGIGNGNGMTMDFGADDGDEDDGEYFPPNDGDEESEEVEEEGEEDDWVTGFLTKRQRRAVLRQQCMLQSVSHLALLHHAHYADIASETGHCYQYSCPKHVCERKLLAIPHRRIFPSNQHCR